MHADVLIIGTGGAGLSLATHLVLAGERKRNIVLMDDRRQARGRSIIAFAGGLGPFEHLATDRWNLWRVADGRTFVDHTADRVSLLHLPADRFYAHCHGMLGAASNVRIIDDRAATVHGNGSVTTARGDVWQAGIVFDSRPPTDDATLGRRMDTRLWRQSASMEVITVRNCFRQELATLADFGIPQRGGVRFISLLPHDARHARVEVTALSPDQLPGQQLDDALMRYLKRLGVGEFQLRHRECDCIALTTAALPAWAGKRVRRIGAAAGAAKPATGEAFAAVQRDCKEIAAAIIAGKPVPNLPQPLRNRVLDPLLLHAIARRPALAGPLVTRVSEAVPPARLARWLNDAARAGDVTAILKSLPKSTLGLAAIKQLGRLLRLPTALPMPQQRPIAPVQPSLADSLDEDAVAA